MKFYINKAQFVKETQKEIDGNNFLVAYDVPIAKTGIQQYTRDEIGDYSGPPDEMVNVYRDREVFKDKELIESFDGIPIVYRHPDNGKIDNINFKEFVVGTVSGVYFKDGNLYAKKLTIIDKEAIRNVLNKQTNELSIGFRGQVTKEKGSFEGTPYHFKEDVIHANHLALCETGKAGSFYAINSKQEGKKMYTNSVEKEHERMKDCMNTEVPMTGLGEQVEKSIRSHMSKVKPALGGSMGDGQSEKEEFHEHKDLMDKEKDMECDADGMMETELMENESEGEEGEKKLKKIEKKEKVAEKHLEKEHMMGDATDPELEESEHKDKDVINSLKNSNKKLRNLINSKNKEIKGLELNNIQLQETLDEAKEYMRNMANKLKQSNLVNSMAGPDMDLNLNRQVKDFASSITSSFLYSNNK